MRWADIEGYPGYQVSDSGLVRSLDREIARKHKSGLQSTSDRKGKTLSPNIMPNGYALVTMGAKSKAELIHRLVAKAFIPGDFSLQVNHKNGDRSDNRAENLEWLTCSENHKHSYANLPRKKHAKTAPVVLIKGSEKLEFESEISAAQHLGVVAGSIHSAVMRGHLCRGYEVYHVSA